ATETESPEKITGSAQIVAHGARYAALDDRTSVLAQITLQTSAGNQSGVVTVGGDQNQGTGFAIGRAERVHEHAERERTACGAFALVKRQQGTDAGFHARVIMPARCAAPVINYPPGE